jgi:hypothetical protein
VTNDQVVSPENQAINLGMVIINIRNNHTPAAQPNLQ